MNVHFQAKNNHTFHPVVSSGTRQNNHTNNIMQLWLTIVVKQRCYSDRRETSHTIVYDFRGTIVNHVTKNATMASQEAKTAVYHVYGTWNIDSSSGSTQTSILAHLLGEMEWTRMLMSCRSSVKLSMMIDGSISKTFNQSQILRTHGK
jgi:hypothetical protein